jgi:hypothetical protein
MSNKLFIKFLTKKSGKNANGETKMYYWYRVFGTKAQIAEYQSRLVKPLWSIVDGYPLYCATFDAGVSLTLDYNPNDKRYYVATDEYQRYRALAKQAGIDGDKMSFEYYMDKAEKSVHLAIPQDLIDATPTRADFEQPVADNATDDADALFADKQDDTDTSDPLDALAKNDDKAPF